MKHTVAPTVELRDMVKTYRRGPEEVHALRGVSLAVDPGEVVALIGPSGSGKTTLLNILCGWEEAASGTIDRPGGDDPAWRDVALLPQSLGLFEELSVEENIALPGRLARADVGDRVARLMEDLGLEGFAGRLPATISMGEQQRTALARAVVLGPRLLLADEPSGHQDADWAAVVFRTIRRTAQAGTACIVATHNEQLLPFADRVLGIRDGLLQDLPHAIGAVPAEPERSPRRPAPREAPRRDPAPDDERARWGPGGPT